MSAYGRLCCKGLLSISAGNNNHPALCQTRFQDHSAGAAVSFPTGPASGRSSISTSAISVRTDAASAAAKTNRKTSATPAAPALTAATSRPTPPRSGVKPRPASRIAPMIATASALPSARKKFMVPVAAPTSWRSTAFWIDTVATGNTDPTPRPVEPGGKIGPAEGNGGQKDKGANRKGRQGHPEIGRYLVVFQMHHARPCQHRARRGEHDDRNERAARLGRRERMHS